MKKLKKSFKKDHTSIILPLYNEEIRLDYCFEIIEKFLKKNRKIFFEIIFVNDGSTDQSKNKILQFIKQNKKKNFNTKIILISYTKNVGKGYAIKRGIFISKSKWILICDLDMSVLPGQYLSWKKRKKFGGIVIKYENLIDNTEKEFKKILDFLNKIMPITADNKKILKTINSCSFSNLNKMENEYGFKEAIKNKFFRKGTKDSWKNELSSDLRKKLEENFKSEMNELGYL